MLIFFKVILRLAFICGVVFLFFTACAAHKKCGDPTKKEKYVSKRYNAALRERDSLCSVARQRAEAIAALNTELSETRSGMATLRAKYEAYQKTSGTQLEKLNTDLGSKQAMLQQREERLAQLETILQRQDSMLNRLNNSVKNALLGFPADELSVEMKNGKVYVSLSDKLLFKSGSDRVEKKGREALKRVAEVLNKNQDVSIAIEGHTDNVPVKTARFADNWDLSAARATSVVRLLIGEYGMDAARLTASGKGEFSPVADNTTEEGKARNRRTEIVLSPKLEELMNLITKNE